MQNKSISAIKKLFEVEKIDDEILKTLRKDERKGIKILLQKYEKQQKKQQKIINKFNDMMRFERKSISAGKQYIAGVDEAGRGPLAGPVVAAAVILPKDIELHGIDDSKKLTESQREYYFQKIKEQAVCYSIQSISNEEIDKTNILRATKTAMYQSIKLLKKQPDHLLIDAVTISDLPCSSEVIIKGDANSVSIAAASVLAKVTRDRMMSEIDKLFPAYDFKSNMGYGTKKHMESLQAYGVTPYHRKSFAPVQRVLVH